MKRNFSINKILSIFLLLVLSLTISSCSFFGEEGSGVQDIDFSERENEQGGKDVVVTVTYIDDDEVKEQIIPSGLDGEDGLGIEEIKVTREKEALRNKVEITLTDGTVNIFYVPDGVRISDVYSDFDEGTNKTYLYLIYSDGSESDAIELPIGESGNGIDTSKSSVEMQADGSVLINWVYTDGTSQEFIIPAGKTGNGIQSITSSEVDGNYTLHIEFTDSDPVDISFKRPVVWYDGYGDPNIYQYTDTEIMENAKIGDYYFDREKHKIYVLTESSSSNPRWITVVDLGQMNDTFNIVFDKNDRDDQYNPCSELGLTNNTIYNVAYGTYLIGQIPNPTRNGYTFKGWATSMNVNATTGYFTELTPVFASITLYAIWEKGETFTVTFDSGEATGEMDSLDLVLNTQFVLPTPDFTSPENKVFDYWQVTDSHGSRTYRIGETYTIDSDITLTAIYKDIE